MTYNAPFAALWSAWFISWFVAAFWASRAAKRVRRAEEARYWAITVAGGVLLYWSWRTTGRLWIEWVSPGPREWALFGLAALGLGFTWWARIHLGTLWSGNVTSKAGHRIVDTGPYGLVRHPIYSGLLLAVYATAALRPNGYALASVVLFTIGFVTKLRLEERFLMEELGADAYAAYRARVPMLVPFWPTRRQAD
ncbi:MAG: isoprenylcysteine carboxylmethyltransferase family protein [Devosia sp.]